MLKEQGIHYDNIAPYHHKNFQATSYGQGFNKPGLDEDTRPMTEQEHEFEQTGFDVNDREDPYEQTDFNLNDREEEEYDANERTGGNFDVNDRADDDFDVNERTGFDVNGRLEEPLLPEQSTSTVPTVAVEENKRVVKDPEDRVIKSTGVYDIEAFMDKMGGASNVN
jgi:hypothetical protein